MAPAAGADLPRVGELLPFDAALAERRARAMPLSAMEEAKKAGMPLMAQLTVNEIPYQRMHRFPVAPGRPMNLSGAYETTSQLAFQPRAAPARATPSFTMGAKNELGTKVKKRQMTLGDLRVGQVNLGDQPNAWRTAAQTSYSQPDQSDPLRGRDAPRMGVTARLPHSEVERRFGWCDSAGAMPGTGGHAFSGRTEQQGAFSRPSLGKREQTEITLGRLNDIGSRTQYARVPSTQLHETHYSLGDQGKCAYATSTAEATRAPPPRADLGRTRAAGRAPPAGASEVEACFKQPANSADYNVISNGPRLFGDSNYDAYLSKRISGAHEAPCGRRQCPSIDVASRGPTGTRQTFDIISGADRPRERW